MINGAHLLLYSTDADADRAFLRDVLELKGIDAGGGWLILALPPAEIAVHPGDGDFVQKHGAHPMLGSLLYLMCDDVNEMIVSLRAKGVECSKVQSADWGHATTIPLPSGGRLGLYQPLHETPAQASHSTS
jgi:hypothetical protein